MKALLILVSLVTGVASAATGSTALNYTRPTTYVDGSTLPSSAITGYTVGCTFTPTGGTATACTLNTTTLPGGTSTSGSVTITYPAAGGTACFTLRTNTATATSPGSQPAACKDLPALAPSDPTNLTVTITLAINIASDSPVRVAVATPVVTKQ